MGRDEFEKIYWELHPRLLAYARGQLDDAGAYDVVASTFETLWKKELVYPADDQGGWKQFTALAFQVLKGHVSNEYRSRHRRASLWRRLLVLGPEPETSVDSSAHVDSAEAARDWLSRLSEADRHVIALFNAGYSTKETAEILSCSVSAAARRRDRAKQRLREIVNREVSSGDQDTRV
ncbi:MAG: sigma-70 family RNA polymerase sigma factor [Nocardioides sp.]|uniref:RNA polymerase sigma factor n=1 Tax=Nocardioides sp. TaxID=35761 RepID=UPI0039E6D7A6